MYMNFRFVTHLDTMAIMPRLVKLAPANWKPIEARGEMNNELYGKGASLLLRAHSPITRENWLDDLPLHETPDLEQWSTMKRLLAQARKAIMAEQVSRQYLSGDMGRAMISRLDAGSTIFWHDDNGAYHDRHIRFHIPLVTNPGCLMFSAHESLHMQIGALWYFNNRVRHSAANFGRSQRLHLIFEMRRIDATDDGA